METKLANGLVYLGHFLKDNVGLILLSGASLLLSVRREKGLLASLAAAVMAYQVWVGGDIHWRMVSPVFVLLIVIATDGAARLAWDWKPGFAA